MSPALIRSALILTTFLGGCSLPAIALAQTPEPLPVDDVGNLSIAPETDRLYLADVAINHILDGRTHVVAADDLRYLGLISTGFAGFTHVSADRSKIYVATSYNEKLTRGTRRDFLETHDAATLSFESDAPISTTRAQALGYRPYFQSSSDDTTLYIQNVTPATSVTIFDLTAGKQTAEVANAGCAGIYPSAKDPLKFTTICGAGTFGTYVVKADKSGADRKESAKFFDADADALFLHAERDGDTWLFVSFQGVLHRFNFDGETAALTESIPLTAGVEGGWRPGGYQPMGFRPDLGILVIGMHSKGYEGSHKNPAEELWVYDVRNKKLLQRLPTKPVTSLTLSPRGAPVVFSINPLEATLIRQALDSAQGFAASGDPSEAAVGEAVTLVTFP